MIETYLLRNCDSLRYRTCQPLDLVHVAVQHGVNYRVVPSLGKSFLLHCTIFTPN